MPFHPFPSLAPSSRHQNDALDLTACRVLCTVYARLRVLICFLCFFFLFPHLLSASKREKKTAKSLDDTPESGQEVGSDRREMPPPFWKHMMGVCVSSFFSQSRRQQTQAAPPLETLLSRDRRYTAGCIPYRAAVLIRARNINEDEETFAFQNDIGFRPSLPSQLLTRRHCGLCVAPRWMVLHQHFVRRRVPSSTRRLFAQSIFIPFQRLFSSSRRRDPRSCRWSLRRGQISPCRGEDAKEKSNGLRRNQASE